MVDLDSISVGDDKSRIHWLSPYPVDMHSNVTVVTKRWGCCSNCGYESNQRTARKLWLRLGTQARVGSADKKQHQQSGLQERGDSADKKQHQESGIQERGDCADKGLQQGEIRFHTWRKPVVISVNAPPDFQCTLHYLPCSELSPPKQEPKFMVASSNGLLLLLRSDGFPCQNLCQHQYYICNQLTKQWVALPPAPRIYGLKNSDLVYFGFIYNPCATCFDTVNHDQMSCRNCSFKVVQFPQFPQCDLSRSEFQVHIYSSEFGKWSITTVQSPKTFRWATTRSSSCAIVHNGCLYWRTRASIDIQEDHDVDPCNNKIHGILNGPPRSQMCQTYTYGKGHLFVCRGSLWLSQYSALSGYLRIWELKNSDDPVDSSGKLKLDDFYWSPYRLCHFSEMNGGFNWFTEGSHVDDIVASDPFDPDIVYMQLKMGDKLSYFTQCDLRNKTLQKVELEHHCHRLAKDIHSYLPLSITVIDC